MEREVYPTMIGFFHVILSIEKDIFLLSRMKSSFGCTHRRTNNKKYFFISVSDFLYWLWPSFCIINNLLRCNFERIYYGSSRRSSSSSSRKPVLTFVFWCNLFQNLKMHSHFQKRKYYLKNLVCQSFCEQLNMFCQLHIFCSRGSLRFSFQRETAFQQPGRGSRGGMGRWKVV